MNPTDEELKFYKAFLDALPQSLRENAQAQAIIHLHAMPLPSISTRAEAEALVNAHIKASSKCLPSYANPWCRGMDHLVLSAFEGVSALYASCFLMLSLYFENDNNFDGLLTLILMAQREKGQRKTPLDLTFDEIKFGTKTVRAPKGAGVCTVPANLVNSFTGEAIRDYKRDPEKGLDPSADPALFSYELFHRALTEFENPDELNDIVTFARYPFSYLGAMKRRLDTKDLSRKDESLMNEDYIDFRTGELDMRYRAALRGGAVCDLFDRLRIESFIEFLEDSQAKTSQKQKFLGMLEACIDELESRVQAPEGIEQTIEMASAAVEAHASEGMKEEAQHE